MFEDIVLHCSTSVTNDVLAAATMSRTHGVDNSRQLTATALNKDTPDPCDYDSAQQSLLKFICELFRGNKTCFCC